MIDIAHWNWSADDSWIVLAGSLCAVAAALLGNFLVLRRMSMLGDAISHAVLPGLAAAFLVTRTRSNVAMFAGAAIVGVLTALFTEWIRGFGQVDEGASMGVVFTALFAIGLIMIVQAADHVDLDPGCVLYGAIELTPLDTWNIGGHEIPRVVVVLSIVALVNLLFVVVFYKELKISSFDPALATTVGIHARVMHYLLMTLVAITAVASFESVGNILVVAMFIVPPAAAYMLTDRLPVMIALSVVVAVVSAVLGHLAAIEVPSWFGYQSTVTAGMMTVMAGLLLFLAVLVGPRHGVLTRQLRHQITTLRILSDDVVALLYRIEENGWPPPKLEELQRALMAGGMSLHAVLAGLRIEGEIDPTAEGCALTERGRKRARTIVRSHRLWEQYLFTAVGVASDRIHDKAERLEHFTDAELRDRLAKATAAPRIDPHGRPIPPETKKEP